MFLPQIVVTGHIKESNGPGEIISFSIPLGPITLVCIVNVPEEDEVEAPVYVKFKLDTKSFVKSQTSRRPRRSGPEILHSRSATADHEESTF